MDHHRLAGHHHPLCRHGPWLVVDMDEVCIEVPHRVAEPLHPGLSEGTTPEGEREAMQIGWPVSLPPTVWNDHERVDALRGGLNVYACVPRVGQGRHHHDLWSAGRPHTSMLSGGGGTVTRAPERLS